MKTLTKIALPVAAFLGASALAQPAFAVVLETKWRAGETLNYDVSMNGDATVQTDAPGFPLAGVPVRINMQGDGQLAMKVRSVDTNGTGTVVPQLAPFAVKAEAFGQKFEANLTRDKTEVLWNGRTAFNGPTAPPVAFKLSRVGKLEGVIPPQSTSATGAATPPATPPKTQANTMNAMILDVVMRALPAFLTNRDLKEGDTWTAEFPLALAQPNKPNDKPDPQLGRFSFKLGPQETVGGRQAYRVAVVGALRYKDLIPANAAQPAPGRLDALAQKVNGNVWFDATLGHIVRAELDVQSGVRGSGPGRANAQTRSQGSFDFTGTVQMQLKTVSQAGDQQ